MKIPAGSTVKKVDGTPFSNGEMTVTVASKPAPVYNLNAVWFEETDTQMDTKELEVVEDVETISMPSVQMLRAERMKMALEAILDLYEPDHRVYKYAKAGLTGKTAAETDY